MVETSIHGLAKSFTFSLINKSFLVWKPSWSVLGHCWVGLVCFDATMGKKVLNEEVCSQGPVRTASCGTASMKQY